MFMEVRKVIKYICQAGKAVGSSFAPSVALLMCPSGPHSGLSLIYKVTKIVPAKADPAIFSSVNDAFR